MRLVDAIGDEYFQRRGIFDSAHSAIFTRKVGHTQRGGRPVQFDRFHAAQLGGHAVDMLLDGLTNSFAAVDWSEESGFYVTQYPGNILRDRWGIIHARQVHPAFYDAERLRPTILGIEYLLPIFTNAIGADDTEHIRETLFDSGNLFRRYHSVNTDIQKRTVFRTTPPQHA
jgi:6-phosphofructokinase 1